MSSKLFKEVASRARAVPSFQEYVWERADDLSEAFETLPPKELRAGVVPCVPVSKNQMFSAIFSAIHAAQGGEPRDAPPPPLTIPEIALALKQSAEWEEAGERAGDWLKGRILDGFYKIYAFEVPRSAASRPVEVSPRVLAGRVNWAESALAFEGAFYMGARLVAAELVPQLRVEWQDSIYATPEEQKRGRPSNAKMILEAFEALAKLDKVDPRSVAKNGDAIRAWLMVQYPDQGFDEESPANSTIARALGDVWRAHKAKHARKFSA